MIAVSYKYNARKHMNEIFQTLRNLIDTDSQNSKPAVPWNGYKYTKTFRNSM